MALKKGQATTFDDLIKQVIAYTTDISIHGDKAWTLMRNDPWPRGTILKCPGLKGKDHFYIGMMPLDIIKGITYREWFLKKGTLATHFVWSEKGLNQKIPFTLQDNLITMAPLGNGMSPYQAASSGLAQTVWAELVKKIEDIPTQDYNNIIKGKARAVDQNQLLIVFNEAYPLQLTESRRYRETIEGYLTEICAKLKISTKPMKIKCILESPYIGYIKPPDRYYFHTYDIFSNSAKVLYFGVFKQYSEDLDWHEQPGGIDFSNLPLMTLQYTMNNQSINSATYWNPPVFPGVGYPAIGMEPSGANTGKFDYFLNKNKHGMTLVINNYEKDGMANWETIYAGLFEPYADYEYAFPAAVIGGTSGATMKGETRYYNNPVTGLKFDYHPKNWSLVHGVPSFACAGLDSEYCPTQVMAMMPDGQWRSFANYIQGIQIHNAGTMWDSMPSYVYPNAKPTRPVNIRGFIRPCERDVMDSYNIYNDHVDENCRNTGYKLEPLELVDQSNNDNHYILGRLPNIFHCTRPIYQYGELLISGKKYLLLPNVWEARKYHLPFHDYVKEFDPDNLLAEDQKEERDRIKMDGLMNIAIRLED